MKEDLREIITVKNHISFFFGNPIVVFKVNVEEILIFLVNKIFNICVGVAKLNIVFLSRQQNIIFFLVGL
jgi:hypothetical protein